MPFKSKKILIPQPIQTDREDLNEHEAPHHHKGSWATAAIQ